MERIPTWTSLKNDYDYNNKQDDIAAAADLGSSEKDGQSTEWNWFAKSCEQNCHWLKFFFKSSLSEILERKAFFASKFFP